MQIVRESEATLAHRKKRLWPRVRFRIQGIRIFPAEIFTMFIQYAFLALILCYEGAKSKLIDATRDGAVTIECEEKVELIKILSTTFQKVNDRASPTPATPPCNSPTAIDVVKAACQYKSYCRVVATDVTFGTTCSGNMLLNVSYACVSGLQGDLSLTHDQVKVSSVRLKWKKHSDEDKNTEYVVERRYVPASQPSAVAGISFDGFGYIKYKTSVFKGGEEFTTKVTFRTSIPNGLLFVAFKNNWSSYAYLKLTNRKLEFAVKTKDGSVNVSSTAITLNEFHTVKAEKKWQNNENTLTLTVDGTIPSNSSVKNGRKIDISVNNVYVGGVPSTVLVEPSVLSRVDGFVGCMNVEQFEDEHSFDLRNSRNVRPITNGCPPAVREGMHFRGTGYAKLTLSSSSSGQLQFDFRIRTSWPNGLLLAAYDNDTDKFLFVETRVDGLDLRYRKGCGASDGPFLVRVRPGRTVSLCDGVWHDVSLTIDTALIVVTIDGVRQNTSSKIDDVLSYSSDVMKNFYLGGMERSESEGASSPTMDEIALGYGVNVASYGGCITDFKVNGQLVDYAKKRNASLDVSFAGCPDFTWGGPTCVDRVRRVGSKGMGGKALTDTNEVKAFTEYLYRVTVKSESGAIVPSKWIVVRTGEDESSSGPAPELDYDGRTGNGTFRWTGPPAIVKDDMSYAIKYSEVYQGSTVQLSDLKFNEEIKDISLPYTSVVSPSTTYVFAIIASLDKGTVTSSYARITTNGRECRRTLYRGTYYRGTTSVSADGRTCLNWSELGTYSNLLALYPESGLGNHSYCRNPISENRTMPWCYTDDTGGCLSWSFCNIDECEDTTCYSSLDNGYGYRGSSTYKNCASWNKSTTFPVSQYAAAGLGDHNYCRNPDPQARSMPWCYKLRGGIRDCTNNVGPCTNDVSIVNYVCDGDSAGKDKCVFPFIYKEKRFFECTPFDRDAPWCSIKNNGSRAMIEWAYCLCPKPQHSMSLPTYSSPVSERIDGTCLTLTTTTAPNTVAQATLSSNKGSASFESSLTTSDVISTSFANERSFASGSISDTRSSSASSMYIGIGVSGGILIIIVVVVLLVVFVRRRGKSSKALDANAQSMELNGRGSRRLSSSYVVASPLRHEHEYEDSSLSNPTAEYCLPKTAQDDSHYEVPVNSAPLQLVVSEQKAQNEYKESIYWKPAKTERKLYDQLTSAKFRVLERSSIHLEEVLGTGQFGTVERGMWTPKGSKSPVVVAVKTLKSESKESKVKFLQEAAIMGQFNHRNVVMMHGVVLSGTPLMIVLEILPNGDLKQYLQSIIANEDTLPSDLPSRLLRMARDIAAGMEYLAKRCFVHRDLAARNVLLGEQLVCKIADFGLSRDLAEGSYYVTKGGQIPIRWTAPEAISFRKYSTSSDVWSYGIVLHEIWTVGKRPYGQTMNSAVIDLLETGFRLPPPPGCSYAIYQLMIECWNPDHHKRPTFNAIATFLSQPDNVLLANDASSESIPGSVGDDEETSQSAYEVLQKAYQPSSA